MTKDIARPFLLIHGGLHGAWCWNSTIVALAARDRSAIAFDLPGHGVDTTPRAGVGIAEYVARATEALDSLGKPATVVCHSMGGMVGTALADARPEAVAALIYVAAVVPGNGDSLNGVSLRTGGFEGALSEYEPGISHICDPVQAQHFFYHDCLPTEARSAASMLSPQALRPLIEPVHLSSERLARVPRAYMMCLQDRMLSQESQQANAARNPGVMTATIDTGHSPFLAKTDEFVDLVIQLEQRLG